MKLRVSCPKTAALTLLEVLVVIVVLTILVILILPIFFSNNLSAKRINCVNNLKQIGLAYRIWPGPQGFDYQTRVSVKNGGVEELVQSGIAYISYQVMSNELASPKLLICPADTNRFAATNFSVGFGNKNVSYFVGVRASEFWDVDDSGRIGQSLLSGDDNFEIKGVPIKSGLLELSTNEPIAWTGARHKFVGNIGLSDGSVQQVTIVGLTNLLCKTGLSTNRLAIP